MRPPTLGRNGHASLQLLRNRAVAMSIVRMDSFRETRDHPAAGRGSVVSDAQGGRKMLLAERVEPLGVGTEEIYGDLLRPDWKF